MSPGWVHLEHPAEWDLYDKMVSPNAKLAPLRHSQEPNSSTSNDGFGSVAEANHDRVTCTTNIQHRKLGDAQKATPVNKTLVMHGCS